MCGLFGVIRPRRYPQHLRGGAGSALLDLGYLAQERGVDSAGLGTLHSRTLAARPHTEPDQREATYGRWRVVTALGPFSDRLPHQPRVRGNLKTAQVVLGHTRWATQGPVVLSNASPMVVDDLIGSHNGDVTAPRDPVDGTDSAWLFAQLYQARSVKATVEVLTGVRGRAALAWVRRTHPELLFLARAALSPLWTAIDSGGALWWASNPVWLREISNWRGLDLSDPVPLIEGTLIVLRSDADRISVAAHHRFLPTSRVRDERCAVGVALRGFALADRHRELAVRNHQVQQPQQLARWIG